MRPFYQITGHSIDLFDEITDSKQFIADLQGIRAPTIDLAINSYGGSVADAIAIYNALRASGKRINAKVLGIAASAAAYVFLAGDRRVMPDNTMMMLHNASAGAYGNAQELGVVADELRKLDQSMQATYVKRTGQSAEKIAELLSKDTYLTAAECKALGLCDEVAPAFKATARFKLPANLRAALAPDTSPNALWALIRKQEGRGLR